MSLEGKNLKKKNTKPTLISPDQEYAYPAVTKVTRHMSIARCGNSSCHFVTSRTNTCESSVFKDFEMGSFIPVASAERRCPQSSGSLASVYLGLQLLLSIQWSQGEREHLCAVGHSSRVELWAPKEIFIMFLSV